jgi:hypothetical protein
MEECPFLIIFLFSSPIGSCGQTSSFLYTFLCDKQDEARESLSYLTSMEDDNHNFNLLPHELKTMSQNEELFECFKGSTRANYYGMEMKYHI